MNNKLLEKDLLNAVEEQLKSSKTFYVKECYDRLIAKNISSEKAKLHISSALLKETYYMHSENTDFNESRYKKFLSDL